MSEHRETVNAAMNQAIPHVATYFTSSRVEATIFAQKNPQSNIFCAKA
jgi:hypothetical protein